MSLEIVPLRPLVSDSRLNGPGVLQNQLKGKVDAEIVERNLNASGAHRHCSRAKSLSDHPKS